MLSYLGEVIVNGHPQIRGKAEPASRKPAPVPLFDPMSPIPEGTRTLLDRLGPEGFCKWVRQQKRLLVTDTTLRDAHQSLFATRMRSDDMLRIAPIYARKHAGLFSLEMWGGATFDTSMRFLKECPWDRLTRLR